MNLNELDNFNLNDAVYFHDKLNPALFDGDNLKTDVRAQLLLIAEDFVEHLGIPHLDIADITLSGSNAAYTYTSHSDIDLHILIDMSKLNDDVVYKELFDAKKTVYNDTHDILIDGYEVELYVQDVNDPVISLGEYSVVKNSWIKLPRKRRANIDQVATRLKYSKLYKLGEYAMKTDDPVKIKNILRTIKKYRQAGLDKGGEFSPENLAFKILRHKGIIKKLYNRLQHFHAKKLSLPENLSETVNKDLIKNPRAFTHSMEMNGYIFTARGTFGANTYTPKGYENNEDSDAPGLLIEVRELKTNKCIAGATFIVHKKGNNMWLESEMTEVGPSYRGKGIAYMMYAYAKMLGNDIRPSTEDDGELNQTELGSQMWKKWGSDAEYLVKENSGYIPSPSEKNDKRWKTALSVDVTPYSIQDNARKLGSKIKRDGTPPLLRP